MSNFINDITSTISASVKPYNEYCSNILSVKGAFEQIELNLLNERTIAHFFDVKIQSHLERTPEHCTLISECCMHCKINQMVREKANSEVEDKSNKAVSEYKAKEHDTFIPDTVIICRAENKVSLYCIEYKVDGKFNYYKLALDFLKYKYYSSMLACRAVFIYVLFCGTSKQPPISVGDIVELNRAIDKSMCEKLGYANKGIFIFDPRTALPNHQDTKPLLDNENIVTVDKLSTILEEIESSNQSTPEHESRDVRGLSENVLYRNRDCFKTNVIYAKIIQENYAIIREMANNIELHGSNLQYTPESNYNINPNNFSSAKFSDEECQGLSAHFCNHLDKVLKQETDSVPVGILEFYRKRSLWILILLQKFAEDNGWQEIARKFNLNIKGNNNIATKYKELLSQKYEKVPGNLNTLCLGLLYFIVNLYPVIFNISQDNKVLGFNSQYKNEVSDKKLKTLTKKLIHGLQLNISEYSNIKSLNFQIELLQAVLNKYGQVQG